MNKLTEVVFELVPTKDPCYGCFFEYLPQCLKLAKDMGLPHCDSQYIHLVKVSRPVQEVYVPSEMYIP